MSDADPDYAGHRIAGHHDCFLMNCKDLGPEVVRLREQLKSADRGAGLLREAAQNAVDAYFGGYNTEHHAIEMMDCLRAVLATIDDEGNAWQEAPGE